MAWWILYCIPLFLPKLNAHVHFYVNFSFILRPACLIHTYTQSLQQQQYKNMDKQTYRYIDIPVERPEGWLKWKWKHSADLEFVYKKCCCLEGNRCTRMYVILVGVPFCTVHNINDRFLFETETLKSLLSA